MIREVDSFKRYRDIMSAFDELNRLIEEEISRVIEDGAQRYRSEAFYEAVDASRNVESLRGIQKRLNGLRQEWEDTEEDGTEEDGTEEGGTEEDGAEEDGTEEPGPPRKRLPRGMRTPKSVFFRPILKTLVELGGAGQVHQILRGVHRRMAGVLREVDNEHLASTKRPRWETTARFARLMLVDSGMLKKRSPRGIWEITEQGRARVQ